MPYPGLDPWRLQYFADHPTPEGVIIPIDDASAWQLYPAHRWVYNKLLICETQGLPHGPHGTLPESYPVFSKPIYNMKGMGMGGRLVEGEEEYLAAHEPGHMWMPFLTGAHVSSDAALLDGTPVWWRHTTGKPGPEGTFDYWTVHAEPDPTLESYLGTWVGRHLGGFTGVVNFETIGGRIIECHLRMAEQWLDLNGPGWLAAVIELYARKRWRFADERREGYSVVLFGSHGVRWSIDRAAVDRLLERPGISSIQITFEQEGEPENHAMPPGGFRLAIVNCWDLAAGRAVREALGRLFVAGEADAERRA